MNIKMSVKMKKDSGNIVIMPNIFENVKADFDDYLMNFEYKNMIFIVNIETSKLENKELENIFWEFYSYLGFVLGYFPEIIETSFANEKYLANIVEQYKTKDSFIRASEQYIKSMSSEDFKKSFELYRTIYKKSNFVFAMFNVGMMKTNSYPEIAIINILQSLDGLFDVLFNSKSNKKSIKVEKMIFLKELLNDIDLKKTSDSEYENVKNYALKIAEISFIDKLRFYINNVRFGIFDYEKKLNKDDQYYIDSLLNKLVNTRNKFSHSVEKKEVLNGLESAVLVFKVVMLYRLLIFEKIGITNLIDKEEFNKNLIEWNTYIYETLKEEVQE